MTIVLPTEIWLIIYSYLPFEHLLKVNSLLAEKKYIPREDMILDLVLNENKDAILWLLQRDTGASHVILNAGFVYTNPTVKFWEKIQTINKEASTVSKMMDVCIRDKNFKILYELYERYSHKNVIQDLSLIPMPSLSSILDNISIHNINFIHTNYYNCYCLEKKIILKALWDKNLSIVFFIISRHDTIDFYGYKKNNNTILFRVLHEQDLLKKIKNYK